MKAFILFCIISLLPPHVKTFKEKQLEYERVKTAYQDKYSSFLALLKQKGICSDSLELFLRVYKTEGLLELWGKNKADREFSLLKSYSICSSSGHSGPKRKEGDYQVPEGFYHLMHFNPWSSFYLSFSINYPNESDLILADRHHPGGNICIHGNCVTIGCIPITDDCIKELYVAAVEAKNNGQTKIPVAIFPCRLEGETLQSILEDYAGNGDYCNLWTDMKKEYDYFKKYHRQSSIAILNDGRYRIN